MWHWRRDKDGQLVSHDGYFCGKCGKPCGLMGHGTTSCKPNPELVAELVDVNSFEGRKPYDYHYGPPLPERKES